MRTHICADLRLGNGSYELGSAVQVSGGVMRLVTTRACCNHSLGAQRASSRSERAVGVQVYLSYRRNDVGGYAGRLADALRQRLGAKSIFQDVTAIPLGQAFTAVIDRALDESDVVLAVIGPGWLTASTPEGRPRLLEPDDFVRLEVASRPPPPCPRTSRG